MTATPSRLPRDHPVASPYANAERTVRRNPKNINKIEGYSMSRTCFAAVFSCAYLLAHAASSDEAISQTFPHVTGDIITRLGYNGDYDADAPRVEANDVFLQVIADPVFHFSDRFRFNTELRVEAVVPPTDDRAFEDQGLFARFLQFEYDVTDQISVHAGKMTPSFALASFVTPGMFGNSYSKEIELIDRVGFGGSYT
ncbi:MAG: hypothetical protein AAGK82_15210, partial [Pseudomonadota bacterium]